METNGDSRRYFGVWPDLKPKAGACICLKRGSALYAGQYSDDGTIFGPSLPGDYLFLNDGDCWIELPEYMWV